MLPAAKTVEVRRLALIELEGMLRAQGHVLGPEDIGREMLEARSESDPDALRMGHAATSGAGRPAAFLGMHRRTGTDGMVTPDLELRPQR